MAINEWMNEWGKNLSLNKWMDGVGSFIIHLQELYTVCIWKKTNKQTNK